MASVQKGVATVFGFPGFDGGDVSWSGIGAFFVQEAEVSAPVESKRVMDEDGELQTIIFHTPIREMKLTFTPKASSGNSVASASGSLAPPAVGSKVTLANFPWSGANGDWLFDGSWTISLGNDRVASYTIGLIKSPNNDLTVAVT